MIASQPVDQDIEQAIQRLQRKMQDVSDSLNQGRGQTQRGSKKNKSKQRSTSRKWGVIRLLKYLFILLLIGATSFILAQIATGYLNNRGEQALMSADSGKMPAQMSEQLPGQMPGQTSAADSGADAAETVPSPVPAVEPTSAPSDLAAGLVDGIGQGASALPPKFSMQAANYDVIDSDLGPVLDIAITVANIGGAAGRPEMFEIELVDEANEQLMKWPMAVSGTAILPQQQMVYKTRLIEPPANFKNIRVTMKK